ncbi:ABC-F type ribosomal protection protein [Viridibacillus sp. YIM B01967]|uniref:ABC-F type ribosomal protection protein n=1 Tax=Viridibacillus soli TaxID=2798301 RepID=A0ABS1H7X7_9BACL|nr:ABC-F type ribosomal protection protein [Viridibacillus soli]MBK3495506.1 ABC-F type ribosomal protection protein [Viridibacillus soli]
MICTVQHISKMLGGNSIFEDLVLDIKTGVRLGIVGRNGSGKTTLFKLISGVESPDQGEIHFKKGTKIGYLAQIPVFAESVTGRDILAQAFKHLLVLQNQMQELEESMAIATSEQLERYLVQYGDVQERFTLADGYSMQVQMDTVVNGLQLNDFVEQPFNSLSGGEKTKIMLGQLLLTKPDLLLLDEPTNHLDLFAVEWLEQYLLDYTGTVVIVSHDRYFLDKVVTKIADLEQGELQVYHCSYSDFCIEKEERLMREFQQYEEQQKKLKKMREAIKRMRQWANEANPPNEAMHRRARNMERALERIEKLRKPIIDPKKMNLSFEAAPRSGKEVAILDNVTKTFGEKVLLQNASLQLFWQEHMAIVGRNGTGKSTILNMLLNKITIDSGTCKLGSQVKIGFLSQHFKIIQPKARLIDVFRDEVSVTEGDARHILAKFMFYGADVFKRIADLSGGERMRLRLAQLMHQDVNLLILDEPTNHLDIESREVLEDALEDFRGTILAISHDRFFLNKIFTKTVWLEHQQLTTYEGPYDWARQKVEEQNLRNAAQSLKHTKKASTKVKVTENNQHIEQEITQLEATLKQLHQTINQEQDWLLYEQLLTEKVKLEAQLEKLLEQWIEE